MQDVGSLTGAPANLVELKAVSKSYDNVRILNAIDLTIRDGEFITLLGPSGSGKTTILRIIGGFTQADSGQILLGGRDIGDLAINRRPFNTVFQDYALFPHMRVFANIAYGLRVRGSPSAEIERRVAQVLDLVQLSGLRDRYPSQLSGGQRQRVALARAIICEPRLILLDEPLAALDVALRRQMQQFLKSIQREIRTTFLFVTHDQEEAITMSDRICVMDRGKILQTGSAQDLYYRPGSAFVAGFFGDNNLIEARIAEVSGSTAVLDTAIGRLLAGTDDPGAVAADAGAPGFAMIRPEAISIAMEDTGPGLDAVIDSVEFGGASTLVVTRALAGDGTTKLRIRLASTAMGPGLAPGRAVRLHWPQGDCRLVLP
jgi:spermidine/putrescine transport system ATP-binding protein